MTRNINLIYVKHFKRMIQHENRDLNYERKKTLKKIESQQKKLMISVFILYCTLLLTTYISK